MEHRSIEFNEDTVKAALGGLPLGGLRVLSSIGSTNDVALEWARGGASDMSVVVADEQTAGRGRSGRQWRTAAGKALAFSLVLVGGDLRPISGRLAGLGAVAVAEACESFGGQATIKWPNDVLLGGRKTAGVLIEATWSGERLEASVMGIGINVLRGSPPPAGAQLFPATCLEETLGREVNRMEVLRAVLASVLNWRPLVHTQQFLQAWASRLAFVGEEVTLTREGNSDITGRLLGLGEDGSLHVMAPTGVLSVQMGEIHLLPGGDRIQ